MDKHERGHHAPRAVHGPAPGEVPDSLTALIDWECGRCGRRWRDTVLLVVLRMALTPCEPRAPPPPPREPVRSRSRREMPERFIPKGEVWIGSKPEDADESGE